LSKKFGKKSAVFFGNLFYVGKNTLNGKNMPRKEYANSSVIVTVIRKKKNPDGKFLEYLKHNDSGAASSILKACKAFYLPYYLAHNDAEKELLKQAAWSAISDLECQILKIKRHFNLEQLSQLTPDTPMILAPSLADIDDEDSEDDEDGEDDDLDLDAGFQL
jgi:hypothetical protein